MAKPAAHKQARQLRRAGGAIKEIASVLGVSPSSVLRWTTDITLSQRRQQQLNQRGALKGAASRKRQAARVRLGYQQQGREDSGNFELHLAGCMLYWAEGAQDRNTVSFVNSDPEMVRVFMRFLRESYEVEPNKIRVRIAYYTANGISQREVEQFWLAVTGLPKRQLRTGINPIAKNSKRAVRQLRYGTCTVRVYSTELAQRIRGAIQAYVGFERTRWLD